MRGVLRFVLLAAAVSGCARTASSDSKEFVKWTAEHLVAVETLDSPMSGAGLESLRNSVGSARVVGVGESRHDTREQLLLKALLVRHLIEDLGFRALILEESFPHVMPLDRYLTTGEGDPGDLVSGLAGWYLWDTDEMLDLFRWMRTHNETREPREQVRVFGMDITAPALGSRRVLEYMETAGSGAPVDQWDLGLDLQRGDFWPDTWDRYGALSDERRRDLSRNYETLVGALRSDRDRLTAASSAIEYGRALRMGENAKMGNDLFSTTDRDRGGLIRERGMAGTVLWILDHEVPGEKAVLWAHNLHVAKAPFRMPDFTEGVLTPMGVQLDEELGSAYVAVGGVFGTGSYSADLPPGRRVFLAESREVMDGALSEVGVSYYLVDLRAAKEGSAAAMWLGQDREWRAQDAMSILVPGEAFDMVYFVKDISRARPTPAALRKFESSGEQR